jgi:hypothetical protein
MIACTTRPEPMARASASNAKQWVGLWVLRLESNVDRHETTLSIKEGQVQPAISCGLTFARHPSCPLLHYDRFEGSKARAPTRFLTEDEP